MRNSHQLEFDNQGDSAIFHFQIKKSICQFWTGMPNKCRVIPVKRMKKTFNKIQFVLIIFYFMSVCASTICTKINTIEIAKKNPKKTMRIFPKMLNYFFE